MAILVGCFLSSALPNESAGPALLILRNVTTILFLVAMAKINRVVARELRKMIETMSSQANKSAETSKVQAVLDFVEQSARAKLRSCATVTVLLVMSSLPPLWPLYTFVILFFYCNVTLTRSHPVCNYLGQRKKPARTTQLTAEVASATSNQFESSIAATTTG